MRHPVLEALLTEGLAKVERLKHRVAVARVAKVLEAEEVLLGELLGVARLDERLFEARALARGDAHGDVASEQGRRKSQRRTSATTSAAERRSIKTRRRALGGCDAHTVISDLEERDRVAGVAVKKLAP